MKKKVKELQAVRIVVVRGKGGKGQLVGFGGFGGGGRDLSILVVNDVIVIDFTFFKLLYFIR